MTIAPAARESFLRRHALVAFFVLAFAISWATFAVFHGPSVFTLGPLAAALIMAFITGGVRGLRELAARVFRWRVPPVWYVAAFLVPVAIALASAALTVGLGTPMRASAPSIGAGAVLQMLVSVVIGCDTLFEEAGWRGFALPRFPARRSRLVNTLVLGVLLAAWHLPVALSEGPAWAPYIVATIASAAVTNWVYYRGRESALLAWIYHTSANTAGQLVVPLFPESQRLTCFWTLAIVNVVVALVVAPRLERKS